MVSDSSPPRRPVLTLDDLALPVTRRPERLHALTAAELAIGLSQGLDLAEGKPIGHAQRVCYIATSLADRMDISPDQRAGAYFGALLHDIGVTLAASDICRVAGVDEETIFGPMPLRAAEARGPFAFADQHDVADAVHQHCMLGAETVRTLDLADEAASAVLAHHERWDGEGFPHAAAGDATPLEARIVAAADLAEVIIAAEISSLAARRRFPQAVIEYAGTVIDPAVAKTLLALARSDNFWLGLYSEDLAETLNALRGPIDTRRSKKRVMRFAEVFADISDAKGGHTAGHSRRTADGAEKLATALALDPDHTEMIRIGALLHDLGLLGVPARVMSKPDILSITEMQVMRQHPSSSEMILQGLPGFEEVATWIARHHERPDGKGYPEMLAGDDIPLEARIIAVADVYSALVSERPHRGALGSKDAKQILLGAAGTQLDVELARLFCTLI
ncbi:MAG: HD domain-containing phosphohydrolase [Dehalococcoidia bacterium]